MGQDQEAAVGQAADHRLGHLGRLQQRPGGQHRRAGVEPSVMAVRTPWGQRHDTPTPASPQRMASHSARATVPCLVTE